MKNDLKLRYQTKSSMSFDGVQLFY